MLTIKAPAKVNLTLEVLGRRPDGFHETRSVLQTIDLYDTLHIEKGRGFTFQCSLRDWSAEKSLVSKVLSLLPADFKGGAAVKIEKKIPLMSGLGGDSSDAAALLKGLNDLYELHISDDNLHKMAAKLGSDVPFFLRGGTALVEGRGDVLKPLPPPQKLWLVLIIPDVTVEPGKTAKMYAALKPQYFADGAATARLAETLKQGKPVSPSLLCNTFENVVFDVFPGLRDYMERLVKLKVPNIHLAGSGPTLFNVFKDKSEAEEWYHLYQAEGIKSFLAATL
jgi:4-diphosphocytidyl-2-C-methyl-D-erythritol kinase